MAAVPAKPLAPESLDAKSEGPPPPEQPDANEKLGFLATLKTFPRSFWMGCGVEMWERMAYYCVRTVLPLYIAQADDPGGLHFSQAQKGTIFAVWALVQSIVPMFSGGFADRYGYKRTIATSVTLACTGYVLMANMRSYAGFFFAVWALVQSIVPMFSGGFADRYGYKKTIATSVTLACTGYILMANLRSYPGFFFGCLVLALGTAIFKPGIQGTLAQSMSKRNSSVGWGLFYWLVNVGAAIGPLVGSFMRTKSWGFVFYSSATFMAMNYLMIFTYKEVESGADKKKSAVRVLIDTGKNLADARLWAVILLFSGFWMMLYQLWDLMPNFYADWVSSTPFVEANAWLPKTWLVADARGIQLKQEIALNLNAALVVCFVIAISFLVARLRVMTSIAIGVTIATIGTIVYGTSPSVYVLFFGIVLFSLGEMLTGPKKTEYFSLIAPKGKKALYLGYVNIPVAFGQALGAKLAGWQYGRNGEKATLALKYLAEKTDHHGPGTWDGNVDHLATFVDVKRTAAFDTLTQVLGRDPSAVNDLLWTTYKPYQVWYWFSAVGFASLAGIIAFSHVSKRWKDLDV